MPIRLDDQLSYLRRRLRAAAKAPRTVEHFIPLFVTLGAATDPEAPPASTIDGFWMGLSKRSLPAA